MVNPFPVAKMVIHVSHAAAALCMLSLCPAADEQWAYAGCELSDDYGRTCLTFLGYLKVHAIEWKNGFYSEALFWFTEIFLDRATEKSSAFDGFIENEERL